MNLLRRLYRALLGAGVRLLESAGLNVARASDYYSPLPSRRELAETRTRWDRPSQMIGVEYDLDEMQVRASKLVSAYYAEYSRLPPYADVKQMGFGPGFTVHDGMWLYLMLRHLKPARYIEIGSGISTWYAVQAAQANAGDGRPCDLLAIDPYSSAEVRALPGVEVLPEPVQSVPMSRFEELRAGDVLFIDSTHVVKIDGDVPHLYLEVLPRLATGVNVHAHDIHFPYNVPHPAEQYVFRSKWPLFWTEAMLLQAFLAFNREFEIVLSPPMLRHYDEEFLRRTVPDYRPVEVADHDTHSGSIWLRRVLSLGG
ncbi:MAG: hypothetical protein DWQ36_03530 [Acidobacteria bacterium]|nr:MAG: hypothetical protein DWQ30_13000 [Acidobacteriota bacterium]REK10667.1 MAG: hypothetical protein DWQ36_03530 [Acidobacteriota bacterium]